MAIHTVRPTHAKARAVDVGIAVAVAVFCIVIGRRQPSTDPGARPADLLQAFVIAATCLPLALRRPAPVVTAVLSSIGCAVYLAYGYTGGPVLLVPLAGIYVAGYALPRRRLWQLLAAYSVLTVGATWIATGHWADELLWFLGWPPIAGVVGVAGNARRRHDIGLAERAAEEDRRQFAEARQRLAEERLQTARDVHDVVGHSLASITLLAAAGSRRVAADPDSAREVLDEIRAVSATALSDVRRALEALNDPAQAIRAEDDDDLRALVARLRRVGLRIDERLDVDLDALEPAVRAGLHGIAQESLTNVMRHAGSLHATVTVEPTDDGVVLVVADAGVGGRGAVPEGVGITGMRRRAEELGGTLDVRWGDRPDRRGLHVVASIPCTVGAVRP